MSNRANELLEVDGELVVVLPWITPRARSTNGRFCKRCENIWAPDARWLVPTADDKALARSVIEAVDARQQAALQSATEAAQRERVPAPADGTTPERKPFGWGLLSLASLIMLVLAACVYVR